VPAESLDERAVPADPIRQPARAQDADLMVESAI